MLIGLLPIFSRLVANCFMDDIALFSPNDFIAFGFVMHISILNELEHLHDDENWKTINNGLSIGFVFIYGLLSFGAISVEVGANSSAQDKLKILSFIMSTVSFMLAYSVFNRLSARANFQAQTAGGNAC